MKSKTWIVRIEAEITNSSEDGQIENKRMIENLAEEALDFNNIGMTLGEFETNIKKLSIKLKRKDE